MSDAVWYYAAGNEQQGPLNEADVAIAIGRGDIAADTLVWREGMQGWAAARTSLPGNLIPQSWADSLPPSLGAGASAGGTYGQAGGSAGASAYAASAAGGYYHPTEFVDVVKTVLNRYLQFSGRARRSEYWYWVLFIVAVSIVLAVIDGMVFGFDDSDLAILGPLFSLATFLPSLGVAFRRMHDLGRSAWWLLIAFIPLVGTIVLIVWFAKRGDEHDNQYGPA